MSVIKDSIQTMDFPEESFDIIWSEGSIFVIGFEKSDKKWRRFLKPNRVSVIHDENKDKTKKIESLTKYRYTLIAQFELPDSIWWRAYYIPFEQLIQQFRRKCPDDSKPNNELNKDQIEINNCKSNSVVFSSFFMIMQKM